MIATVTIPIFAAIGYSLLYLLLGGGLGGVFLIFVMPKYLANKPTPTRLNIMKSNLAREECRPCSDSATPLKGDMLRQMQGQLGVGWKVIDEKRLEKQFTFSDFRQALQFTNRVGEIAEQQGHHPDIYLTYGEVRLQIWTHKINGLTESDFTLAAQVDGIG